MVTSKREEIIDQIKAAWAAIKKGDTNPNDPAAAEYKTSLGHNVFYHRDTDNEPIQDHEVPCMTVAIFEKILETSSYITWDRSLEFDITLIARTDTEAWRMADDIETSIRGNEQWDDLAVDTDASDDREIDTYHGENKYVAVSMKVRIQYITDRHNADQ